MRKTIKYAILAICAMMSFGSVLAQSWTADNGNYHYRCQQSDTSGVANLSAQAEATILSSEAFKAMFADKALESNVKELRNISYD